MKASELLVKCLENEGVEYIFGIIGKEVIDIADSLANSKITYIPVRHEQGAAFMADVYGRVSGKPAVCLTTLGPGATNLVTGVASAKLDHSPLIAIVGQKGQGSQHQSAHQYIDLVKIFEPAVKWSVSVKDANTIPEIVRSGFRIAKREKPGPVVMEVPENIASAHAVSMPLPIADLGKSIPLSDEFEKAVKLLNESNRPFIVVGNGAIRMNAISELQAFIEKVKCPVTTSFMAKGILPKGHPQNYYTFGFNEKDYALRGIEESDLLVVIGFDHVEKLPAEWNLKKVQVLHIDGLPAEVDEGYPVKAELVGDIKEILKALGQFEIVAKPWQPEANLQKRIEEAFSIEPIMSEKSSLTIENVIHSVEKLQTEATIVISDVGSHKVSIARTYQPLHARQLIISNGLASMGISIPGAIGAKLASPEKTVICITGDGGALMNFAELETAKRIGVPFVVIVLNDAMLKIEDEMMKQNFGESYGVTFSNPDFLQLAQAFGIKGYRPGTTQEFETNLAEAILSNEIALLDVKI